MTERARKVVFTTVPAKAPLTMLRVEPAMPSETQPPHPASFLVTLNQIGLEKTRFQEDEIKGLPSLREAMWSAQALEESAEFGPGLEFRTTLSQEALAQLNLDGPLELVKTFRLAKVPADDKDKQRSAGYRLTLDLEIINRGQARPKDRLSDRRSHRDHDRRMVVFLQDASDQVCLRRSA